MDLKLKSYKLKYQNKIKFLLYLPIVVTKNTKVYYTFRYKLCLCLRANN